MAEMFNILLIVVVRFSNGTPGTWTSDSVTTKENGKSIKHQV